MNHRRNKGGTLMSWQSIDGADDRAVCRTALSMFHLRFYLCSVFLRFSVLSLFYNYSVSVLSFSCLWFCVCSICSSVCSLFFPLFRFWSVLAMFCQQLFLFSFYDRSLPTLYIVSVRDNRKIAQSSQEKAPTPWPSKLFFACLPTLTDPWPWPWPLDQVSILQVDVGQYHALPA